MVARATVDARAHAQRRHRWATGAADGATQSRRGGGQFPLPGTSVTVSFGERVLLADLVLRQLLGIALGVQDGTIPTDATADAALERIAGYGYVGHISGGDGRPKVIVVTRR